jgi:3-methyl-2-oxobutanoate hydroxymethyltransferase
MTSRPRTDGKLPLTELSDMKRRREPIVMVTAYDYPGGRIADAAGIDVVLVGDSAAMTVLGNDSTVPATMEEMVMLTRAAARGARRPLVVADMPFGSFQVSDEEAVRNAIRFLKEAEADAVKIEGAGPSLSRVLALVGAGIPVMGHIGLTSKSPAALRSSSRPCRPKWRPASARRSRSPRSGSAPGAAATDRCSCSTTFSVSTRVSRRGS